MYNGNSKATWLIRSLIVFLFCAGGVSLVAAQGAIPAFNKKTPGFIDDNFNPVLGGLTGTGSRILVQPDGKLLVAGNFQLANGMNKNGIARFNADGTLDASFNSRSGANGSINAIALQSTGKILIGGAFTAFGGQTVGNIARLNSDGTLDTDFNSNGVYSTSGANSTLTYIVVGTNDQFYIGGNFTNYNGVAITRLARLNANGSLDTTFAVGTGLNSAPSVIAIAPDGKILVSGFQSTYNGTTQIRPLIRINADGTLDATFTVNTGANTVGPNSQARYIEVLQDNKILIGGDFATYSTTARAGMARLNSDGTLDTTFDAALTNTGSVRVAWVSRQPDGKLIIVGLFNNVGGVGRVAIARISADGALDTTFNAGTGPTGSPSGVINSLGLQADGKPVITGTFSTFSGTARSAMARLNIDGSMDTGMVPSLNAKADVFAIARHTDGKLFLGGNFSSVNGTATANFVKLNADGSTDLSFNAGTGPNSPIQAIGVQSDGKAIIVGNFTQYNGAAAVRIARINTDGTIDSSFNVGTGFPAPSQFDLLVQSIVVQPDGKVLIGGGFTTYNGTPAARIARLNTDGTLDATFNASIGTGPNQSVLRIALQNDGKIILAGDFSSINAVNKGRIARLNADGTNDASFDNGGVGFAGRINDVAVQADGKIVVGGSFSTFNGSALNQVARLNSNGSRDTSFDPTGVFSNSDVASIVPTPEGKYIVVGSFTTAAGLPKNRIVRLRANGSLDPKFVTGLGPAGSGVGVSHIVPHNGRYIIGGSFSTFNTSARTSLVSISNTTKAPVDYDGDGRSDWAIARHTGGQTPFTFWINYNDTANADDVTSFVFGIFTVDGLQPGDFDGDGMTDVAVWRAFTGPDGTPPGYWITFSSTNTTRMIPFGLTGDRNVLEDYDGDGKDDMAIYRVPETQSGPGTWYYRGSFNNPNGNLTVVPWGMRYGDQADQADDLYPGDFDGDGKADFRVQRRADISVPTSNTPAIFYTLTAAGKVSYDYFGWASDRSIPGDYDGDGKTDIAISRGFNMSCAACVTTWYIRYTSGIPDATFQWGAGALDQFAQGDYDGDGITDPTVYRRAGENNFYVLRSSDQAMGVFHWGADTSEVCGFQNCDIAIATYNNR
ncbi:MAG TPA: hypothetical protein VJV05_03670 [Pyrinomonadaceae bacterium]|nr:hypothetical protein [Pyrinomonadaceae bacterium]